VSIQRQVEELSPGAAPAPKPTGRRWAIFGLVAVVVAALFLALVVLLPRPVTFQYGTLLDAQETLTDFTLDSSLGAPVALSDFRGKYVLLYFGYTNCPDVCPLTLAEMRGALDRLGGKADKVQPIFITLDPARDTPEHMAAYLQFFHPTLVGLTGPLAQIQELATRFGIFFEQRESGSASGYLVDHTSVVLVVDPEGRLRGVFPNGVTGEQMASDLDSLIR
jgi:protein SCO1/2